MEGVAIRSDDRTLSCGPCPRCGKNKPEPEELEPYGLYRDRTGAPVLILFHCSCRTSRSIRWEQAPADLRRKAEAWFAPEGGDRVR